MSDENLIEEDNARRASTQAARTNKAAPAATIDPSTLAAALAAAQAAQSAVMTKPAELPEVVRCSVRAKDANGQPCEVSFPAQYLADPKEASRSFEFGQPVYLKRAGYHLYSGDGTVTLAQ